MRQDHRITQFWEWFVTAADRFGENFDNKLLVRELDARVKALGDFAWELGPGLKEKNALVISTGGDCKRLRETRRIVGLAPKISGWEIHPAKPPKQWQPIFKMGDVNVDACAWRFVRLQYPDGSIEILVEAPSLADLSDDQKTRAVEIVLEGFLGEQRRLEMPMDIGVVSKLDQSFDGEAKPIAMVRDLESALH